MKVAIVTDSGSNYYNEKINIKGVYAVPLQIINGDMAYQESVEISIDEVNDLMEQKLLLKTSLPALGHIEDLFEEIKKDGYDKIVAVPITSGISGTIDAMKTAAAYIGIDFVALDCYSTFHNSLDTTLAVRKLLDEGVELDEIIRRTEQAFAHSDTIIIPDDLQHLARGGRLSPLAAKLGGFLKIKPILHLNGLTKGIIEPMDKVRTMTKAFDTVIENMRQAGVDAGYRLTVAHVRAKKECDIIVAKLKSAFPNADIRVHDLISTVSVHVGIGAIALQYMQIIEGSN